MIDSEKHHARGVSVCFYIAATGWMVEQIWDYKSPGFRYPHPLE